MVYMVLLHYVCTTTPTGAAYSLRLGLARYCVIILSIYIFLYRGLGLTLTPLTRLQNVQMYFLNTFEYFAILRTTFTLEYFAECRVPIKKKMEDLLNSFGLTLNTFRRIPFEYHGNTMCPDGIISNTRVFVFEVSHENHAFIIQYCIEYYYY